MRKILFIIILNIFLLALCKLESDPVNIIKRTVSSIDTISSISYNQHLIRTNPQNSTEVIKRDRSFIYKKLHTDSIIGAKAHIYYLSEGVCVFEDIYNGDQLIRKNNYDSTANLYDLIKYPELKTSNKFWRKNSPYTIQAMLNFTLINQDEYKIDLLNDTIINNVECYCIKTILTDKTTIPGFSNTFTENIGFIETSYFYLDKTILYPLKIRLEHSKIDEPEWRSFTDHEFYDIIINPEVNDKLFSYHQKNLDKFSIHFVNQL